jgi:transposase
MLTVKAWEQIRRDYYVEHKSIREIARETGHARRTVSRMVELEEPPTYRRRRSKEAPKLGPYKERIQALLAQNATLPRKQRWTSPLIYREICRDGYQGAESTVRHYVGQARKLLHRPPVYLPLEFDPGTDAQADWGEGSGRHERRSPHRPVVLHEAVLLPANLHDGLPQPEAGSVFHGPCPAPSPSSRACRTGSATTT